ncbi:MAG: methionine gamma-lyase family protein [Oscillospiraceae bacterium]|nr:methionine gamma-lyase family protein [Oscillospiraceae bacterium]
MSVFEFSPKIEKAADEALNKCKEQFAELDRLCEYNGQRVLKAFIDNRVSEIHMKGTDGYGYNDDGRDKLDAVFAQVLGAEDALVRHNFVNGTHALTTALFGVLRPNDTLLAITGDVYDTLQGVVRGDNCGSLKDFGVKYDKVDLLPDGTPDYAEIKNRVKGVKVAYIQRSRGYSLRPSLTVEIIGDIIKAVREVNKDCIVMVDNCYGELVEDKEPTGVGADLIIGSLIKNMGGGIAQTGGYIAGKADLVEQCAYRLTCPGAGKEVGCSLNQNRGMYLGLFHAPESVCAALKTSVFATAFFEELGYDVFPKYNEKRSDIIAALKLGTPEKLIAFCEGIQSGSPVDSFASPEPWDMPGYDSQVIMAAGAFTMGASIELSADAPLREPYAVWLQGGLTFPTGKAGIMLAARRMEEKGLL